MAISTGLALLGSAALSVGGQLLGGNAQSKAARDAANISAQDNAANRSFLEGIYNRNAGYLSPWQTSGATANNAIMELLGLVQPAAPAPQNSAFAPQSFGAPTQSAFSLPMANNDLAMSPLQIGDSYGGYSAFSPRGVRNLNVLQQQQQSLSAPAFSGAIPQNAVTAPAPSARSAFDAYRQSTGYDFRFNEGTRALQSAFSRNLESGAASKAALRFGQGIASDEFGRYMDLLRGQSQLGLSGASALAGVGQNFGNTVVAGNTAAANAAANARLYSGASQAQNWANMGSSFGSLLGFLGK